jgi:hypothetical protein
LFLQPEDPSVKRASRNSPTLIGPAAIMAPVATQMSGSSLGGPPVSPANPAFLAAAAAAAAAATGSPAHMPNMLSPMPLRPTNFSPVTNLRDNPPCNTLFIGNLGDNTSEQELRALLSSQPGYRWVLCSLEDLLHQVKPMCSGIHTVCIAAVSSTRAFPAQALAGMHRFDAYAHGMAST